MSTFDALILAGGRSSRMGTDKAWLVVEGQSLLARQMLLARELGAAQVFVSGRSGADYSSCGCEVLHDRIVDAGPFGGVERAMQAMSADLLLVMAVDLPKMSLSTLRVLADGCTNTRGIIPRLGKHLEPLVAFYPRAAISIAEQFAAREDYSVSRFAQACVDEGLAVFHDVTSECVQDFFNWNTPDSLHQPNPRSA